MVELRREARAPGPVVTGFAADGFMVGDAVYRSGLWLTPEKLGAWDAPDLSTLGADHLADLIAIDPLPEFLLLGTGDALARPSRALIEALEERDIGVEAMDSRAAARSWGLLRAEGRWIVAALMPLKGKSGR